LAFGHALCDAGILASVADVLEFVAAAVVVILLSAADGGAAEDGEKFYEKEAESW
jgi:hypothetical protein